MEPAALEVVEERRLRSALGVALPVRLGEGAASCVVQPADRERRQVEQAGADARQLPVDGADATVARQEDIGRVEVAV